MGRETLELRPVGPEDRTIWGELWTGYLEYYETALPASIYDTAFAGLLSDDPTTFSGLLAWDGDEALGLVHWLHHRNMWRPEGVLYLQDLFTTPAARGQGVGRRLIEAVYADADAKSISRVYWMTQEFNYAGRMLYDRVGTRTPFIKYERPAK